VAKFIIIFQNGDSNEKDKPKAINVISITTNVKLPLAIQTPPLILIDSCRMSNYMSSLHINVIELR
jgi:hypothetical protein